VARRNVTRLVFVLMVVAGCSAGKENGMAVEKGPGFTKKSGISLPDIVGTTHVVGRYYHTKKDYLNEGADDVLAMGSRVIKLWFYAKRHEHPDAVYPYNSKWEKVDDLVEGAKLPYWKAVFDKPFTTYILCVTSLGRSDEYWVGGISQDEARDEAMQFYELTRHFLTTYQGSGKTFIFQHWEGDWMTSPDHERRTDENLYPEPVVFENMVKWLNARQAGVNKAREEFGQNGVHVYHAAEINRVVKPMLEGKPRMVNRVIPFTNVDLVSYSAHDAMLSVIEGKGDLLGPAIDFIKENLPPSAVFGDNSVYVGEYGVPENEFTKEQITKVLEHTVQTALDKKCPYVVYWQLYCNEPRPNVMLPSWNNADFRGWWLIRADGSKSHAWHYFCDLLD